MCTFSDFHEKGGIVYIQWRNRTFRSQWIRRYTSLGCFCSSSTPRHPPSTFSLITRKSFESSIQLRTYSPRHELLSEFGVCSAWISASVRVNKNGKLLNCSYHVNSFININHPMFCHVGRVSDATTEIFLFSRHYRVLLERQKLLPPRVKWKTLHNFERWRRMSG